MFGYYWHITCCSESNGDKLRNQGLGLKYITQYSEIAKPNRVYVPGDKINTTWADKVNSYAFNDTNGDYYMITDKKP
jgi:hypothetical protein